MKIKELFSDSSKWTKGAWARPSKRGLPVPSSDPTATCFCIYGAVIRCYAVGSYDIIIKMRKELGIFNIIGWNDDPNRKFRDVKKLVEKLDI